MIQINKIKEPFIYYCQKVIPLAFDESLSYYEVLCHLTAKIKEVIDEQNIEGQAIEELQNKYLLLVDYVEHYFDNLDVQEEINNKLDDMAESGQLQEIIAEYLNFITNITFNTVSDMKTAENLANGNYVKTLGFYEVGDGGGSYYHIRNVLNDDDIDEHFIIALSDENLVAEFTPMTKDFHTKQVGLKGDDLTDETEIIQKFFDYLNNYDINKIIDEGIYLTNDTINIVGRIEQIGQTGQGYKNGTYRIKFNNACIHCNNEELDYAIKIYQFYDGIIDGLHLTRDTYYENKVLFSGCKRTVIKNFWLRNIEINTDPSLLTDTLDSYSCYHLNFEDGYLRGQVIIDPYNATTHYINSVYFNHCSIHAFGIPSNIVLKQEFSKQNIVFNQCDLSGSDNSVYDVAVRQVNPYLSTGVGSCSITAIDCYYDTNVSIFKNNTKNNIIYNEIGSRFSGNETQNLPQSMEEYFTTTRIGISSNHVKGQLPISNINYIYNGTIKSHTLEDANTERLFGASTGNITKSYVQKSGLAKYDYVRRLTFETTTDTYQIAQASKIQYTGPACVGIMFEFISGKCDIEFTIGYSNQQYTKINKTDIKSGINIFTCGKQDQIFNSGSWGDVRINFTNIEEGTVLDIYEIGLQSGEIYMLNAYCKGE